jgi:hypothetical protein
LIRGRVNPEYCEVSARIPSNYLSGKCTLISEIHEQIWSCQGHVIVGNDMPFEIDDEPRANAPPKERLGRDTDYGRTDSRIDINDKFLLNVGLNSAHRGQRSRR